MTGCGSKDKAKPGRSKKERQLIKIIENSDTEDDSEHELSHYLNDRVKLMKQVLKQIKPKRIKSMAPDCMKKLDIEEINSMLLEELLGISNKRLKMIFTGQNVDEDTSSSTDPEEEKKPIDVISLDDVTDDDFIIEIDSSNEDSAHSKKYRKIKEEPPEKQIKKERNSKSRKKKESEKPEKSEEENLMSVLELLELQARARAIRSQLALEATRKAQAAADASAAANTVTVQEPKVEESDEEVAIIVESPSFEEIVITSSESENDNNSQLDKCRNNTSDGRKVKGRYSDLTDRTESNCSVKDDGVLSRSGCDSESKAGTHSHVKKDGKKPSSHGAKSKDSSRRHYCRRKNEKLRISEQTCSKSTESPTINENASEVSKCDSSCGNDIAKDTTPSDDTQPTLTIKSEGSSFKDTQKEVSGEDPSQKSPTQTREQNSSEDDLLEVSEIESNKCSESKIVCDIHTDDTQASTSHSADHFQDLTKSPKAASIQQDIKEIHLHSHQEGLVINIDEDDIDAINS